MVDFGMRANMPRTNDRHVNEKPFRIALNLLESAQFYPLDLQKIVNKVWHVWPGSNDFIGAVCCRDTRKGNTRQKTVS